MLYYLFLFCFIFGLYQGFKKTSKFSPTVVKQNKEEDYNSLLDFVFFSTNK
jgi:hypothetical protein